MALMERAAKATADFYLANTPTDGIPYWDTGAPGLLQRGDYLSRPAEADNPHEPVDASAAAIAAQGLLPLGSHCGRTKAGARYWRAGIQLTGTLLREPYLSTSPRHEGLLLHVIYHRPRGWDYVPKGKRIPQGESALWGDYHLLELAVYTQRLVTGAAQHAFYAPV